MAVTVAPRATKLHKGDRNNQILLSKPKPYDPNDYRPAFGQEVEIFAAATIDTEIQTYPLIEDIPPNTSLVFPTGSVLCQVGASKDDTIIQVVSGATALTTTGEKATVSGVEQVITLAVDVAVGDRILSVVALDESLEARREIEFNNGVKVRTTIAAARGATQIFVEAVTVGDIAAGTTVIPNGSTAALNNYELICSANSINRTQTGQTLTDYVFCSGLDALKDVSTRERNFQVSGKFVPYDFGLERIEQSVEQGAAYMWMIASEGKVGGYTWSAQVIISTNSDTNAINQNKDTSFTLEVNGEAARYDYPQVISY